MNQNISEELKRRKETLNNMYCEFDRLKSEGNWIEAWKQLINTLNYANETLKISAEILRERLSSNNDLLQSASDQMKDVESIKNDMKNETSTISDNTDSVIPKMIAIPKKQTIH